MPRPLRGRGDASRPVHAATDNAARRLARALPGPRLAIRIAGFEREYAHVAYLIGDTRIQFVRRRRASDRAEERADRAADRGDPTGLRIAVSQLEALLRERAAYGTNTPRVLRLFGGRDR
jgi:hypothetical protein